MTHVAVLGLGPSVSQYLELTKRAGGRRAHFDETWVINSLGEVFDCDLIFHQDDVRIQQLRADANPQSNIAQMLRWLKTTKTPVMTSRAHPDYPSLVEFPLHEVVAEFGQAYFNSTAAYAIAFAIWRGDVTQISVFGFDFTYANSHQAEKGRACVEFWIGIAVSRGIDVKVPHVSTLLDACVPHERLYGYDTLDVKFERNAEGELVTTMTPKAEADIPTAEQIEWSYDHSRSPNALVEAGHATGT